MIIVILLWCKPCTRFMNYWNNTVKVFTYDLDFIQVVVVIVDFTTPGESHLYGLPLSLCKLLRPHGPFFVLRCFLDHP